MKKPIVAEIGNGNYAEIQVIGGRKKGNKPYLRFQAGRYVNECYYFAYVDDPKKLRRVAHAILKALGDE